MAKLFIILGSCCGMLAVIFGAFGAHALKGRLDDYAMGVFETAVQYHFYHSFALLAVGIIALSQPHSAMLRSSGWLFFLGLVIFSGSLYLLSLSGLRWTLPAELYTGASAGPCLPDTTAARSSSPALVSPYNFEVILRPFKQHGARQGHKKAVRIL